MMHDCIEGMPEPLYGFTTKIMLVENERCELNVTCDINGNKIGNATNSDDANQSEIHKHTLREDLTPRLSSGFYASSYNYSIQYQHHLYDDISRQTGEEFSANGPASCRTSSC